MEVEVEVEVLIGVEVEVEVEVDEEEKDKKRKRQKKPSVPKPGNPEKKMEYPSRVIQLRGSRPQGPLVLRVLGVRWTVGSGVSNFYVL